MPEQRSPAKTPENRSPRDVALDHLLRLIAWLVASHWRRLHGRQPQEAGEKSSTSSNRRRIDLGD